MSDNNSNELGKLLDLFVKDKDNNTAAEIAGSSGGSSDSTSKEQEFAVESRRTNAEAEIFNTNSNNKRASRKRYSRTPYTSAILAENHNEQQQQQQQWLFGGE